MQAVHKGSVVSSGGQIVVAASILWLHHRHMRFSHCHNTKERAGVLCTNSQILLPKSYPAIDYLSKLAIRPCLNCQESGKFGEAQHSVSLKYLYWIRFRLSLNGASPKHPFKIETYIHSQHTQSPLSCSFFPI